MEAQDVLGGLWRNGGEQNCPHSWSLLSGLNLRKLKTQGADEFSRVVHDNVGARRKRLENWSGEEDREPWMGSPGGSFLKGIRDRGRAQIALCDLGPVITVL
jgi:hypothetical protein